MTITESTTTTSVNDKPAVVTTAPLKAETVWAATKAVASVATPPNTPKPAAKTMTKRVVKKPLPATTTVAKSAAPAAEKLAVAPKVKQAVKAPAKTASKLASKVAAKLPAKAAIGKTPKVAATKVIKEKKSKLVSDRFTIPKAEYAMLGDLKQRAGKLSNAVKKNDLIRAGVKALTAMADEAFLTALKAVPAVKTGRSSKAKAK